MPVLDRCVGIWPCLIDRHSCSLASVCEDLNTCRHRHLSWPSKDCGMHHIR
jgi:hypothetical protein